MLEIICQGAPGRANEDAFVAYQRDDGQPRYILAAIDGATAVTHFPPLQVYLEAERNGITAAALAATVTRDSILEQLGSFERNDDIDPRQLVLRANDRLRHLLDAVAPGIFDASEIRKIEPDTATILDDPRKIRLFLPAAVLTLITIDTKLNLLRFAHAGDTALLVCYTDGHVETLTLDKDKRMNYESALVAAASQVIRDHRGSMLDAVNDPVIRALDRDHRIYHNYVDEYGNTAPGYGIGVVDGLPQLADYVQAGMMSLGAVAAVMVVSDGFLWPAPVHETPSQRQARLERMWGHIRTSGVRGYLAALRAEERADANREKYPRFKLHDDATAVVLWLEQGD